MVADCAPCIVRLVAHHKTAALGTGTFQLVRVRRDLVAVGCEPAIAAIGIEVPVASVASECYDGAAAFVGEGGSRPRSRELVLQKDGVSDYLDRIHLQMLLSQALWRTAVDQVPLPQMLDTR